MVRAVSSVLLMRVAGIGFQLGWFMLLVRLLPIEQVGLYSAVNAFWMLSRALGPLGSDQALMRRLPALIEEQELSVARRYQRFAAFYLVKWYGLLLIVLSVGALLVQQFVALPFSAFLILMIAAVALLNALNGQQVYVMLAAKRPLLANGFESIGLPLILALLSAILSYYGQLSLTHLLLMQACIIVFFCFVGLYLVYGRILSDTKQAPLLERQDEKDFARQSRHLLATSAMIHINMRLPLIVAPFLIGAAQTALLETAMRFATLLGLVSFAAAQVTLPNISALARQQKQKELQELIYQASWLIFLPSLLLYAILAMLGHTAIILVAGAEYEAAYSLLLLIGVAYVIAAAAGPLQHVFTMSGKTRVVSQISVLEGLASLVLMGLLAPMLGAMGLACAISFGMVLRNGLVHGMLPAKLGLHAGVFSAGGLRWAWQKLHA